MQTLILLIALAPSGPAQRSTATVVLKEVRTAYQKLHSYQDQVRVNTPFLGGAIETSFVTWYTRPNRWRLDYSEPQPNGKITRVVLWQNKTSAKFWDGDPLSDPLSAPDLQIGLGSLAMIAGPYVKLVPSLLDPKTAGGSILDGVTWRPTLQGGVIGREACHRIAGSQPDGGKVELWVEKRRKLILKLVHTVDPDRSDPTVATVTLTPTGNSKIPAATFAFSPPPK